MKDGRRYVTINGHLDIILHEQEDEFEGVTQKWTDVLIHGDPDGLRSLANALLKLADLDQESIPNIELPVGEREHEHLRPNWELSESSNEVIIGRLDAKGTGAFYDRYVPRKSHRKK